MKKMSVVLDKNAMGFNNLKHMMRQHHVEPDDKIIAIVSWADEKCQTVEISFTLTGRQVRGLNIVADE